VQTKVWVKLSQPSAVRRVTRVEIVPASIVPRSRRVEVQARAIEAIDGRPNGYIVYTDDQTYPEGGVFWTRAGNRGDVLVEPAGQPRIVVTLHVGPTGGSVRLSAAGRTVDIPMKPDETREVPIDVPAGATLVPIGAQASAWFRPASVDPQSTDTRELGVQVRVELK
jgi:hypothetical protein